MQYWFGSFTPERVFLSLGPLQIYWYSILLVAAVIAAYYVARRRYLAAYKNEAVFADLAFYLVASGLVGARLWHVFVFQWAYYAHRPLEIIQIWRGGIAIQGAIVAGAITVYFFAKKHKLPPLFLSDCIALAVPLGQAIGRWGNFFNQELYGLPTALPWGIYIEPINRVSGYERYEFFHPAFLYESLLNAGLFGLLWFFARKKISDGAVTALYLAGYGTIRFIVDFVRVDPMPTFAGFRLSQLVSLSIILVSITIFGYLVRRRRARAA